MLRWRQAHLRCRAYGAIGRTIAGVDELGTLKVEQVGGQATREAPPRTGRCRRCGTKGCQKVPTDESGGDGRATDAHQIKHFSSLRYQEKKNWNTALLVCLPFFFKGQRTRGIRVLVSLQTKT